jgi:hypothetical protein
MSTLFVDNDELLESDAGVEPTVDDAEAAPP